MDIQKNLLCDVFDAYLYDDNDNLLFMSENLTGSDIKGDASETEVRNGRSNGLFAKLYSNKKIDISLKTNAFSFGMLALLCGTTIGTGEGTCYSEAQLLTVTGGKITLAEEPKYPTKINMFVGNEKITGTIALTEVTIDSAYEGKAVKIMPYEFDSTDDEVQEIIVEADKFPEACKLVLKGVEKSQKTKTYKILTIVIPQASVSASFSLSTSSEVKPVETEIKLSALTDNGRLMKITETPYGTTVIVTPITDLSGNGGSLKASLTWSAIGQSATNVTLKYKKSTDSVYSNVLVGGTTGVYIATALNSTSTSAEVLGLTALSTYNFKISFVVNGVVYESNIDTEKATA